MRLKVFRQIFVHFNGIAIGAIAQGLMECGVLERLANSDEQMMALDDLCSDPGLVDGYLKIAFDILAGEGLCRIETNGGSSCLVGLTDKGRIWFGLRQAYQNYNHSLSTEIFNDCDSRYHIVCEGLPACALISYVQSHLRAPSLCLAMLSIAKVGWIAFSAAAQNKGLLNLLLIEGWVHFQEGDWYLSEEGEIAVSFAQKYAFPVCYFSIMANIPALLVGKYDDGASVERALDIEFSGKVFEGPCRDLFLEQLLPLFDTQDLENQPHVIVDTGCGDGTVLIETYRAIIKQTNRGKYINEWPLLMVGAEYEKTAENRAVQTLRAAEIPHLIIAGDISNPDMLHQTLKANGIDRDDILHISKSVIHNRTFIQPVSEKAALPTSYERDAYYVTAEGDSIPSELLFDNLVEFFKLWAPWVSRHGMIAIEAHCWAAEDSRKAGEHYPMSLMKATHGFSNQYLVSADFYQRAAIAAKMISLKTDNIHSIPALPPTMTINHFVTDARNKAPEV